MHCWSLLLAAGTLAVTAAAPIVASVTCSEQFPGGSKPAAHVISGTDSTPTCKVFTGTVVSGALAWGSFEDTTFTNGWADLKVHSAAPSGGASSSLISYAAGYLEGYFTANMLCDFVYNLKGSMFNGNATLQGQVTDFLAHNYQWIHANTASNASVYWGQVAVTYSRIDGIVAGHASASNASCSVVLTDVLMANSQGDLGDIMAAVAPSTRVNWSNMTLSQIKTTELARSHCTVMIRYLPDMSELYAAQNMWWSYSAMNRIFKLYSFPDPLGTGGNVTVQFSSYPGCLTSTDDFHQLSTKLVVMETTNDFFNTALYDLVTPESLVSYARVFVCNALTRSPVDWAGLFPWYNSGTYNNMWIVLDYNKFVPGQTLQPHALYIVEQLPGTVVSTDMTNFLGYGYFPSYNRPYDPYIFNISGCLAMEEKYGPYFSYHGNPRATIFRRDAFSVLNLDDMKSFMRYNDWENDPLSLGSAANQIAARYDLIVHGIPVEEMPSAGGAIDAKITSHALMSSGQVWAVSGPTHTQQPVFTWDSQWGADNPHQGQPNTFDFDYVLFGQQ